MRTVLSQVLLAIFISAAGVSADARAQVAQYYIGIDARTQPFNASPDDGGAAYPDAPNYNRLTLLYQHGDHYHGIGQYVYTGPGSMPTLLDTNSNNRLPESFSAQPPLSLSPGEGVYSGKHHTMAMLDAEYSDLEMRNTQSLSGVDDVLFHSSSGRWNGSFAAADVHLKLLSVSSPQLNVGTLMDPHALSVGSDVHVGGGDEMFSFTPVFWVDESAPAGDYWAELQLVDASGTFGSSGRFFIDVRHVPEPSALSLAGIAAVVLCVRRRRQRA